MTSSQGLVKFMIGCWTRPGTTLVNTKEKMSEWPWSSRSPKDMFQGLHYPLTWSNKFCDGWSKRDALIEKGRGPWQRIDVIMNFWWKVLGKRRWRQENGQTWFFNLFILFDFSFKTPLFGHKLKSPYIHLLLHGHSSWSTFGLHLVRGPMALWFHLKRTRPWKKAIFHGLTS